MSEAKTVKFSKTDKEFVVEYAAAENMSPAPEIKIVSTSGSLKLLTSANGFSLYTPQDLNAFAEAISNAWKDHQRLKQRALQNE